MDSVNSDLESEGRRIKYVRGGSKKAQYKYCVQTFAEVLLALMIWDFFFAIEKISKLVIFE